MNTLKTNFKIISIIVLTAFVSFSCKDDDDSTDTPTPEVIFASLPESALGDYTGSLTYTASSGVFPIANTDGTATISETSDKVYTITFSDNVPELTGIRFIESNGEYVSASDDDSTEGVSLDGTDLAVGVTTNGNNWAFSGDK